MKPFPLLLAVLLFGIGTSCTDRTDRHQKALEELDRIIERRDAYGRTKNLRIAARRDELAAAKDPRKRIALAEEIYKEYYNYDIDSAYHYARRMLALAQSYGDGTRINCARVYLAKTVLNGGMYGEAFRILHQVDTTRLAPANKSEYYNVYRSYLSKQLSGADPALKARYRDSLQFYNVLRIRNLPEGSVPRKELEAMMYCKAGEARKALDLLLPEYEAGIEDTHLRAMVAYRLALIYEQLGDADRRKEYLIRATADDLRTPVREGMALYTLAGLLLEEGDVERANRYINCSMEDALYCNYRSRMQQSSEMVQQIAGAYIDSLDAKRRAMGYVTIVVSLLVVVLLGSFFTILVYYRKIRQISAARLEMNRQLRELNEHIRSINGELRDANNIKDEYVGHYLSLCSRYIVRINDYRKLLLKVYKDGDCDALIRELRTKNPADAEYKEFLAIFDETFLHLFPDFVALLAASAPDAEYRAAHPGADPAGSDPQRQDRRDPQLFGRHDPHLPRAAAQRRDRRPQRLRRRDPPHRHRRCGTVADGLTAARCPLCSAHSCGTPLPRSAPCAAHGGKSRDDFSSRNRLRIRIRYPQVSCLPEGKYLFFTIPRPIFTSCRPVGTRAVNVLVKPRAESNAVRAMPRREMEHENERFR